VGAVSHIPDPWHASKLSDYRRVCFVPQGFQRLTQQRRGRLLRTRYYWEFCAIFSLLKQPASLTTFCQFVFARVATYKGRISWNSDRQPRP